MAMLYQNDDAGKGTLQGVEAALQRFGAPPLVAREAYEANATEVSAQLAKLRDRGAEVVFLHTAPNIAGYVLNQAATLNFAPQFLSSPVAADASLFRLAPDTVEGLITLGYLPLPDDLGNPGIVAHRELLKKYALGQEPTTFTVTGQAAAELMVETLKRAGKNLTRPRLIEAAESIKGWMNSFGLEHTMGPEDHAPIESERILRATKTKFEFISDFLQADF